MHDLNSVIDLAFSPANTAQAAIIAFLVALIMQKYADVWTFAIIGLVIDRFLPVFGKAFNGYSLADLWYMLTQLFVTIPDDIGILTIRLIGIMVMVSLFFFARHKFSVKVA